MSEYTIARKGDQFDVAKFDGSDVPDEVYQVWLTPTPRCVCPAWASGRTRPCKHIEGVQKWVAGGEKPGFINLTPKKASKIKGKPIKREPYIEPEDDSPEAQDEDRSGHDLPFD